MESVNLFFALALFLIQANILHVASENCNDNAFYCTSANAYKLCIDGGAPDFEQQCERGLGCHMDCPVECSKSACTRCNTKGYACASDTEFVLCLDGTNIPDPLTKEKCPTGYYCSSNCNSLSVCTARICPVTCTSTTRLPVEGNTTAYYLCEVGVEDKGEVAVTTHACPSGTEFNPASKLCTATAKTTTTTPAPTTLPTTVTTTPTPHVCTKAGRFPNTADCGKYHLCTGSDGMFNRYDYNCPASAPYFNPTIARCGAVASACVNV